MIKLSVALFLSLLPTFAIATPTLTRSEIEVLARRAADAVGDDRTPENAQCMIEARGTIRCSWTLPTGYTDDLLEAVFSMKDGSVINAEIEPGC